MAQRTPAISLLVMLLACASSPIALAQSLSPAPRSSASLAFAQTPTPALPSASAPATAPAAQTPATSRPGPSMTATAKGPFDVKLTPQGTGTDPTAVGRMTLDKTFRGDLEATSVGEMLAVRTAVAGSAGYVAIERVTATLAGRAGTFALQHWGMMDKGTPELKIAVIADSGTGQLTGLTGTMTIDIQPGGKHFYTFVYALPPAEK
jgi:hypothetical protein